MRMLDCDVIENADTTVNSRNYNWRGGREGFRDSGGEVLKKGLREVTKTPTSSISSIKSHLVNKIRLLKTSYEYLSKELR